MDDKENLIKLKEVFLKCAGYIDEFIELSEKEDASEEELATIIGKFLIAQSEIQL